MADTYAASLAGPKLDAHLADLAAMLASVGRHAGHRQRQDGPYVVCSCRLRAQADLAAVRAQLHRPTRTVRPVEPAAATPATEAPAAPEPAVVDLDLEPEPGPAVEPNGYQQATHAIEHDRLDAFADAAPWTVVLPDGGRLPAWSEQRADAIADRYPGSVIEETNHG